MGYEKFAFSAPCILLFVHIMYVRSHYVIMLSNAKYVFDNKFRR